MPKPRPDQHTRQRRNPIELYPHDTALIAARIVNVAWSWTDWRDGFSSLERLEQLRLADEIHDEQWFGTAVFR